MQWHVHTQLPNIKSQTSVFRTKKTSIICLWYQVMMSNQYSAANRLEGGQSHHISRCKHRPKLQFSVSTAIGAKTGIDYPDLKPTNEFWNRVRVPGNLILQQIAIADYESEHSYLSTAASARSVARDQTTYSFKLFRRCCGRNPSACHRPS